jgi:ribonuclease P protein component
LLAKFEVFNREKDIETLAFYAAFLTPKRIGKATKRNRTRRKMKEVFRQARPSFLDEISSNLPAVEVHCAFIAKTKDYPYQDMSIDFSRILQKLSHQLIKKYGMKPTDTPS